MGKDDLHEKTIENSRPNGITEWLEAQDLDWSKIKRNPKDKEVPVGWEDEETLLYTMEDFSKF